MFGLMNGVRVSTTSSGQVPLDSILSSGVRADPDIDALATKADREAAVLLWNYHDVDEPAAATPTSVTISGIPANVHRVLIAHYRIDDTHSNAYTVWKEMGSPQHPTTAQYAELKSKDGLQLLTSPAWMEVVNGKVEIRAVMQRQSVSLLRLSW
jgi:xylan 1,4-beta-xylosidase